MTDEIITGETCQTCGGCCVSPFDVSTYVDLEPTDIARLAPNVVRLHVLNGALRTRWHLVTRGPMRGCRVNKCALLRGDVGWGVQCSMYEDRPVVCRTALQPGDAACRAIREDMKNRAP